MRTNLFWPGTPRDPAMYERIAGENSPTRSGLSVTLPPSPPPTQPVLWYAEKEPTMASRLASTTKVTWAFPRGVTTPCVRPSAFSTKAPVLTSRCAWLWPAGGHTASLAHVLEAYHGYVRAVPLTLSGKPQPSVSTAGCQYAQAPFPSTNSPYSTPLGDVSDDVAPRGEVAYQEPAHTVQHWTLLELRERYGDSETDTTYSIYMETNVMDN